MTAHDPTDPFDFPLEQLRRRRSAKWTRIDPDALPLWVAEMDVHLAEGIRSRLQEALDLSDTGYSGDPTRMKDAFASFARDVWDWDPDPARMTAYPDLAASGVAALAHFAGDDRRAVLCPPVYNAFTFWFQDAGVTPVEVPLITGAEDPGAPDLAGIERAFADGVRVALISSPHNPLGRLWRREELSRLAQIAAAHDAVVIADEIHAPLTHPGHEFVPYLSVSEDARRTGIALHSASKGWNLAGLKASLTVETADGPRLPHSSEVEYSIGLFGLLAAEAAFSDGRDWLENVRACIAERAAHVAARLKAELPAAGLTVPEAGYLMWIDLREVLPDEDRPAHLIHRRSGLFLSPGHTFGTPGRGHVRLNLATSWTILDDAIDRLVAAVNPAR
ncbi:MAG: aminotransferase class I/II-fold pyridoxal phosphate-dependent enzyme [Brachybacterium sp.]|nr:aminotransferase class I/II-fold pyridoxal phosphate-dependent enzyme [Brachybacterium sp.]